MTETSPFSPEQIQIIRQVCVPFGLEEITNKPLHFKEGQSPHIKLIDATQESKEFPGLPVIGIYNGIGDTAETGHAIGAIDAIRDEIQNRFEALAKKQKKAAKKPEPKAPEVKWEDVPTLEPESKSSLKIIDDSMIYHDPKDAPKPEPEKKKGLPIVMCCDCGLEVPTKEAMEQWDEGIQKPDMKCGNCRAKKITEPAPEPNEKVPEHGINQGRNRRTENMTEQSNVPATREQKTPAVMTDAERDAVIEKAKAERFLNRGSSYKVQGKERPDSAMIQHIANDRGVNIEIIRAEQTDDYAEVLVRGTLKGQVMDAIIHHDFKTIYMLRIMEIAKKHPHIIEGWDGINPILKGDAKIQVSDKEQVSAQYYVTHALLTFKNFALRDAVTKASSICQAKLLNRDWRDEDEKQSEQFERELVESNKKKI